MRFLFGFITGALTIVAIQNHKKISKFLKEKYEDIKAKRESCSTEGTLSDENTESEPTQESNQE